MTHDEGATSEKEQVRQAKRSLFSDLSSRGKRRLELQERQCKYAYVDGQMAPPF